MFFINKTLQKKTINVEPEATIKIIEAVKTPNENLYKNAINDIAAEIMAPTCADDLLLIISLLSYLYCDE